ncbi:ANK [Mytilus edulis]|uniref:ANK n=1 Tax=Mytilus edulis TaxID=6550 RepID=A0A8S3V911_MYTED|nr:ANK [Mytilus edulis]
MANASPLHISCWKKYSKIVEQLVVRNAQLNSHMQVYYSLSAHDSDCERLSPLFISVMKRDFETVHLLLKSNSDSGLLTFNSVFISSLFNDGTFVENEFFLDYRTDLSSFQAACILGYDDIVDEIIKYYPDINQKFKITPIFLSFFDESCELMHQFLSLYGYDNKDFEIEVTPLIFSVLVGNSKVLKTLLSHFANQEFESSFCLIHVVSLKRNILDILVSTYLEPNELLLSKCTLNALSIACLKNDAEICQLLLSKYADPLYVTQLTAMHVICFRGYDSHLECIMELRLPVDRYFRMQCSHIIACSKFDDTNADVILSSPGFNDVLDISNVELACFHDNVDFLKNMIKIFPGQSYNSVMNVTPLFLSCLFENDRQFQLGMFMSDMKLQSNIPYQMVISRCLCTSGLDISDCNVYPLTRDNMKINNVSLLLKNYCMLICDDDEGYQALKVFIEKIIPDPIACYEVNLLMLLLLDLQEEGNINMSTASKLLQNIDVCIKVLKLNFTYLLLLKNVSLELLPVSTYSELSQKPLSFTAVEAFYLIHGLIPDSLFMSTEAKYQTLEINPILIACLHENIPNVEFILRRNADINSLNELSLLLLTSFQYNEFDNKLIQNTVIAGENIDSMCVSIELKPIHIACFYTENIDFVRILFGRHNCNLKSAAKLSTVVLYFINQDEDFEIALNHNILEAVSDLTPLNIACLLNNTSLVEYLLTKQIEVDSVGSIFPHHMNFSHCSDIAELITIQSEFILTSLHIALLNDNEDVVGLLIEYGANVDISISLIIELNIGNMYISTHSSLKAIHLACLIDNDNIFGTILSKTTFIDEKCAVSLWHLCYLEVVSGVKMYETFDREIELNLNPMHIFCIIGDCAHVEMLLNADANCNLAAEMPLVYTKINSTDRLYKFPLHLAAESGNLEMCTLLLKHNADNEVKTNVIGFKPWHLALYHGHVDVLKHLLTVRTTIRKSLFMFTLFLFILRVRYGNIVIQFIAKSKNVIPLLSFYRYLLNVFGFSLIP